jgi:hypothetical protein
MATTRPPQVLGDHDDRLDRMGEIWGERRDE